MESFSQPANQQLLINRYQTEALIGVGSMGQVYRARDTLLGGVPVAVKFLARTLLNQKMKLRFAHEARTGAQLGQKNIHIVRVIDYGVNAEEIPFYVMEYLAGQSLGDLLPEQGLPLAQFLTLARHICLGLQCAHQGVYIDGELCPIIHRDIKPSNIFVIQDPALGELAKILDFGIANFVAEDQASDHQTHTFMGTLAYCSPEQIEGGLFDGRSDIYSLGVTMFELLTGQIPLQAETNTIGSWYKAHQLQAPCLLATANPGRKLPKDLEGLVMGCLAKSPADRPQSMAEILSALESIPQVETPGQTSAALVPRRQITKTPCPQNPVQSVEQACWQAAWPTDRPIAKIVFTKAVGADQPAAGLWVMLSEQETQRRLLGTRYNQFLFTVAPHPMVLWITAIHDRDLGALWLPCYLDLKQPRPQETIHLLSSRGYYPLLFFDLEKPQHCANVKILTIAPEQPQLFQNWLAIAENSRSSNASSTSKTLLKAEFEKIKPKILQKLETASRSLKLS